MTRAQVNGRGRRYHRLRVATSRPAEHVEGMRLLELACQASLHGVSSDRVLRAFGYLRGHGAG